MKKVKIQIREVLTYERDAIILIPEDVPESKISKLLDEAERRSDMADEVTHHLKKLGCTIIEDVDSDLTSPDEMEVEIIDYDVMS